MPLPLLVQLVSASVGCTIFQQICIGIGSKMWHKNSLRNINYIYFPVFITLLCNLAVVAATQNEFCTIVFKYERVDGKSFDIPFYADSVYSAVKNAESLCGRLNIDREKEEWIVETYTAACFPNVHPHEINALRTSCSYGYSSRYHTSIPAVQVRLGTDAYFIKIRCGESPRQALRRLCSDLSLHPESNSCKSLSAQFNSALRETSSVICGMPMKPAASSLRTESTPGPYDKHDDKYYKSLYMSLMCHRPETLFMVSYKDWRGEFDIESLEGDDAVAFPRPSAVNISSFPDNVFPPGCTVGAAATTEEREREGATGNCSSPESIWYHIMRSRLEQLPPAVTVVVTSCNRSSLLGRTLHSFVEYNTYPIYKAVIIDDCVLPAGALDDLVAGVDAPFPVEIIYNEKNMGQIASIDKVYADVETPYIFHLEDDWEFYASGFIEESLAILEADSSVVTVHLRAHDDINRHPLENRPVYYHNTIDDRRPELILYSGFTLNPGLRRTMDYIKVAPFYCAVERPLVRGEGSASDKPQEADVSNLYNKLGARGAVTHNEWGYVRHIGWNYHVLTDEDPVNGFTKWGK